MRQYKRVGLRSLVGGLRSLVDVYNTGGLRALVDASKGGLRRVEVFEG